MFSISPIHTLSLTVNRATRLKRAPLLVWLPAHFFPLLLCRLRDKHFQKASSHLVGISHFSDFDWLRCRHFLICCVLLGSSMQKQERVLRHDHSAQIELAAFSSTSMTQGTTCSDAMTRTFRTRWHINFLLGISHSTIDIWNVSYLIHLLSGG